MILQKSSYADLVPILPNTYFLLLSVLKPIVLLSNIVIIMLSIII